MEAIVLAEKRALLETEAGFSARSRSLGIAIQVQQTMKIMRYGRGVLMRLDHLYSHDFTTAKALGVLTTSFFYFKFLGHRTTASSIMR